MNTSAACDFSRDFSRVEAILQTGLVHRCFSAACVLAGRGDRVLYRRAFGYLSPKSDAAPCNEETRFDIASLTKPLVTASLCMKAVERGLLCLDDKLSLLPDMPPDKKDIRIYEVLNHTAGFGRGLALWEKSRSPEEFIRELKAAPLACTPGKGIAYSCYGYILLGKLLEKVYALSLSELAQREVFDPLEMNHTQYLPSGTNIAATLPQPDGSYLQGIPQDGNTRCLGCVGGSAGVFSTVDDLALFAQMLLRRGHLPDGSPFLCEAAAGRMLRDTTPQLEQSRSLGFYLPFRDHGFTGDLFPQETAAHTGYTGCSLALDPNTGIFLVLLTNHICYGGDQEQMARFRRQMHNAVYATCNW